MQLEQSVSVSLAGLLVISLGLAVRRGDALAAWCLVGVATVEVLLRLWLRVTGGLLWPILFLFIAFRGALYLHKHRRADAGEEVWVRILYELAFLQAAWTGIAIVWSLALGKLALRLSLGVNISLMNLVDVGILLVFGVAAWKRQVWSGYALTLYQLTNVHLATLGPTPETDLVIPLGFAFIYGFGAFRLHRMHGPMPVSGRVVIGLVAAGVTALIVSSEWRRPTGYQRLMEQFEGRVTAIPGYRERVLASEAGVGQEAATITGNGLRRLTDAQLIERAKLFGVVLSNLDERNCAEQLRGGRGTVVPGLQKLPKQALQRWVDLAYAASKAEIENRPPIIPDPSDEAIAAARDAVWGALPEGDAIRFQKIVAEAEESWEKVTDSDTCWFLRKIIDILPQLAPPDQRTISRLIVARW